MSRTLDLSKAAKIVIDIRDWRDKTIQEETLVSSEDDVYRMLEEGMSTSDIAVSTLVSRELGVAPQGIIRPNKVLIRLGAMEDASKIWADKKREIRAANGRRVKAKLYVGKNNPESDEPSYVNSEKDPDAALKRSTEYLLNVVPGHVRNALVQVYAGGGDVQEVADMLIDKIQYMTDKLVSNSLDDDDNGDSDLA